MQHRDSSSPPPPPDHRWSSHSHRIRSSGRWRKRECPCGVMSAVSVARYTTNQITPEFGVVTDSVSVVALPVFARNEKKNTTTKLS